MPKTPRARTHKSHDAASIGGLVQKKSTKSVACQRCHSRKVKCSGGHPCSNCRDAEAQVECVYPPRDRQVKFSQQYVEELLRENERLRDSNADPTPSSDLLRYGTAPSDKNNQETAQNPLLEDRPWFLPVSTLDMPIHISEAADAAFATRFRQTLATVCTNHLPRISFIKDDPLLALSETQISWPPPARARFLVKVALDTVCRYYHIVRKSLVLESLEMAIRNGGDADRLVVCKLLALFALGEAYSTKIAAQDMTFPGLAYFAQARRMVSIPSERPRIDTVEIALLLAIYSYVLNRRHSAYIFASSAVRLGIITGMHMNVPNHQFRNPLAREHRTRLWWTAYILDRNSALKLGHPVSIADEDILVDLPSSDGLDASDHDDFGDAAYILQSIELIRLSAQSVNAIYSRRKHVSPFSQRVQASLKDLTKWSESLPIQLQLHNSNTPNTTPNHVVYLHLTFNQSVILATRPILLHVLRIHHQSWTDSSIDPKSSISDGASTLAETCIQCSRHSYRLMTEAWINGSFAIFDYFNAQYLFSAATVLAISSLLGSPRSQSDGDSYNNAVELLQQLDQSGNFGAKEFRQHIDAMKQSMESVRRDASSEVITQSMPMSSSNVLPLTGATMTAGMALAEPSLQEFLAEPDLNIQAFDNLTFDPLQPPYWTEMWGDDWTAS